MSNSPVDNSAALLIKISIYSVCNSCCDDKDDDDDDDDENNNVHDDDNDYENNDDNDYEYENDDDDNDDKDDKDDGDNHILPYHKRQFFSSIVLSIMDLKDMLLYDE